MVVPVKIQQGIIPVEMQALAGIDTALNMVDERSRWKGIGIVVGHSVKATANANILLMNASTGLPVDSKSRLTGQSGGCTPGLLDSPE